MSSIENPTSTKVESNLNADDVSLEKEELDTGNLNSNEIIKEPVATTTRWELW